MRSALLGATEAAGHALLLVLLYAIEGVFALLQALQAVASGRSPWTHLTMGASSSIARSSAMQHTPTASLGAGLSSGSAGAASDAAGVRCMAVVVAEDPAAAMLQAGGGAVELLADLVQWCSECGVEDLFLYDPAGCVKARRGELQQQLDTSAALGSLQRPVALQAGWATRSSTTITPRPATVPQCIDAVPRGADAVPRCIDAVPKGADGATGPSSGEEDAAAMLPESSVSSESAPADAGPECYGGNWEEAAGKLGRTWEEAAGKLGRSWGEPVEGLGGCVDPGGCISILGCGCGGGCAAADAEEVACEARRCGGSAGSGGVCGCGADSPGHSVGQHGQRQQDPSPCTTSSARLRESAGAGASALPLHAPSQLSCGLRAAGWSNGQGCCGSGGAQEEAPGRAQHTRESSGAASFGLGAVLNGQCARQQWRGSGGAAASADLQAGSEVALNSSGRGGHGVSSGGSGGDGVSSGGSGGDGISSGGRGVLQVHLLSAQDSYSPVLAVARRPGLQVAAQGRDRRAAQQREAGVHEQTGGAVAQGDVALGQSSEAAAQGRGAVAGEPCVGPATAAAAAATTGGYSPLRQPGRSYREAGAELYRQLAAEAGPAAVREPAVILVYGPVLTLAGYPPFSTRASEIYHMGSLAHASKGAVQAALYKFGRTEQRCGR